MGDEVVPEVDREVFVHTAEASYEVVLEGANGSFGCVASMDAWWDQLVSNGFFS